MINFLQYRYDKYTSTGNDGIISKIFELIDIDKGFFVEFGAWDGVHGCNCRKLVDEGWSGIFIEPVLSRYLKLYMNYRGKPNIQKIWSKVDEVGKKSFDHLMNKYAHNINIDFCSIDIDGLDVEIFDSIEEYLPKVVCIEGGQMLPPNHERVSREVAGHNIQQSLSVIAEVGRSKGYEPICSYQDTFLVKKPYVDKIDVTNDIERMYFDGLIAHYRRLPWIQKILKDVSMDNPIVDDILAKSGYDKYGWDQRKQWAIDTAENIRDIIEERYAVEINK
jgi:hypothetical protein